MSVKISVHNRITELIRQHGSLLAVARVTEIDSGYLSRLSSGEKSAPGERVLRRLGLVKRIVYFKKDQS